MGKEVRRLPLVQSVCATGQLYMNFCKIGNEATDKFHNILERHLIPIVI